MVSAGAARLRTADGVQLLSVVKYHALEIELESILASKNERGSLIPLYRSNIAVRLASLRNMAMALACAGSLNLSTSVLAQATPSPGSVAPLPASPATVNPAPRNPGAVNPAFSASTTAPIKVGIALGGGGARGFAHIGVLRIDKVSREKPFGEIFEHVQGKLGLAILPITVMPKAIASSSYDGLYKGTKFATFLDSLLPPERQKIEQLPTKFTAVSFNLIDGKSFSLQAGDVGKAIQASCTLPELRQPVPWQGRLLVDGGVISNLPCQQVKDMGAEIVIAVNVDERMSCVSDGQFKSIGSVTDRCLQANLTKLDDDAERRADAVIHPDVTGIKLLSRSVVDMDRAIMEGEKAANDALPAIMQLLKAHNIALKEVPTTEVGSDTIAPKTAPKLAARKHFLGL
jgi:NTE family protein